MDKLRLTAKEKLIFQAALEAAHDGGRQDATFVMSSTYQLVEGPQKILARVTEQYCEDEDAPEMTDKKVVQKPSLRYREPGDGHDEFS
jgi:hypothetical protein